MSDKDSSGELIYGYRCNGTMWPEYHFIKVFDSGKVIIKKGLLFDLSKDSKKVLNIPEDYISQIKKVLSDNSDIFSINKIEDDDLLILDGVEDEFIFSDGEKNNTIIIDNFSERRKSCNLNDLPNLKLLATVHRKIRKILINAGVDREYL